MAQYNLAVMLGNDQVNPGPAELKLAYAWSYAAAKQGYADAIKLQDILDNNLDPATLAEAQKLAEQYFKSYVEPFH